MSVAINTIVGVALFLGLSVIFAAAFATVPFLLDKRKPRK